MREELQTFIRHLYKHTSQNPIGKGVIYERSVLIQVRPFNDCIYISEVRALEMRKGYGTKAMKFLTNLADTFGVTLRLVPHRFDRTKEGMTSIQLRRWYKQFGFVPVKGQPSMTRKPVPSSVALEPLKLPPVGPRR